MDKKANTDSKGSWEFWRFTAINMLILLAGLSFYWILWGWAVTNIDLTGLQATITYVVYMIQSLLGWPVEMIANTSLLYSLPEPGFTVDIIALCTGLGEMLFFAFLVLLFRGPGWRTKLNGLAASLPLIFLINIARLVMIYPLAEWAGIEAMQGIHWHIWKWGMFLILMAIFAAWYMLMARKDIEERIAKAGPKQASANRQQGAARGNKAK